MDHHGLGQHQQDEEEELPRRKKRRREKKANNNSLIQSGGSAARIPLLSGASLLFALLLILLYCAPFCLVLPVPFSSFSSRPHQLYGPLIASSPSSSASSSPSSSLPSPSIIRRSRTTGPRWSAALSRSARLRRQAGEASSRHPPPQLPNESRLPINVRNNGGEIFHELISSNSERNYTRIEFTETDGSLIRVLVDFRNNVQIFRLVKLGEQDLNERRVESFCFVTRLQEGEFIPTDAMTKLTQKNPTAIRQAEQDHGSLLFDVNLELLPGSDDQSLLLLSDHIESFCQLSTEQQTAGGPVRIYASEADLSQWRSKTGNRSYADLTSIIRKLPTEKTASSNGNLTSQPTHTRKCGDLQQTVYRNISSLFKEPGSNNQTSATDRKKQSLSTFFSTNRGQLCHCSLVLVLPFYPCSIKYCEGKAADGSVNTYRCGIKTCRKRYEFRLTVEDKLRCLADFDPTTLLEDGKVDAGKSQQNLEGNPGENPAPEAGERGVVEPPQQNPAIAAPGGEGEPKDDEPAVPDSKQN